MISAESHSSAEAGVPRWNWKTLNIKHLTRDMFARLNITNSKIPLD